jgi:exodeoxyribonuclease V beta subunit
MSTFDDLAFDLTGPLPSGVTVLEASAGTGKTYTIAALAARYIADGLSLNDLLLVTFTRMATGELRERVRERLVGTEQELSRHLAGAPLERPDEIVALLADGDRAEVEQRRARLARAIANFDAATIATTHGFCQEVLAELGTLGDLEPDVQFEEDVNELIDEVVDDLYVRRFVNAETAPIKRAEAGSIARLAIANPTAVVHPLRAAEKSDQAMRMRLALAARKELERRKRLLSVMTYDDLLTRLKDALAGANGPAAVARLQRRYKVVLIDEFQDTDPVQWEIVKRAFGSGGVTLVLIADPKQAIYAFRGADVYAYLKAAEDATTRATLRINRRSDQPLIDAYDALFGDAKLGHRGIAYRTVEAAPAHQAPRLTGAPSDAALRIRIVDRTQDCITLTGGGAAQVDSARDTIARDLADDVVALLRSNAKIEQRADDGSVIGEPEPVRPGHIAVLVPSHRTAAIVQEQLTEARVPAVINGAGSVFATKSALDWMVVLQALERPAYSAAAKSAALTPLIGWTAEQVATAGEGELEQLHQRLHAWARVLRLRGVAALAETISLGEHVAERVLSLVDGERELTDLDHVARLLHAAATSEQLGTAALAAWLRQRIADAASEGGRDDLTRRLESDAEAVQVLTIHRAKGLEFPIVYCPFVAEPGWLPTGVPVYFHDPDAGEDRAIDVGLKGSEFEAHEQLHRHEERGEDLRLMYVALTRARHQATIWWAGVHNCADSPLSRLVFSRDSDGNVAPRGSRKLSDEDALKRFATIAESSGGTISVELTRLGVAQSWGELSDVPPELRVAAFDRDLDLRWRRTSYSDITAGAHELVVASEPEADVVSDEPEVPDAVVPEAGAHELAPSLLGEMPVGARVGTFVHSVLEASDFAAPDLVAELTEQVAAEQSRRRVEIGDPAGVVRGLAAAIETPFGDDVFGAPQRLRDLTAEDRLDELTFELPLAGGDEPSGELTLSAIASVLRDHLGPDDPLAGYAERLADPRLRRDVRGYLNGSLDLVMRVPGTGGSGPTRYAVVDYKTNWLGGWDEPLTAWDYRPQALAAEMTRAHYGLQALLYTAALHRYLRWRVPGYDPARDLAGVHYLFVRGMLGPDTPVVGGGRCGAWSWSAPGGLVDELSDVLDGAEDAK